ncbi:MAG: Txe/YoeB family addiction module toxin [Selenomonadaceae bacterium]|nr:Txe/YoeB family addiction module toxin [Selenomonadaceae bacterium]
MRKIWSSRSWEEYLEWQNRDKKILQRINKLIKDIERNGVLNGIGKPEPLKHYLTGWYSRRIDEKNRLIYR